MKVQITGHEIRRLAKGAIDDKDDLKLLEGMADGFYVLFYAGGFEPFSVVGPFPTLKKCHRFLLGTDPHAKHLFPARTPNAPATARALAETSV